MADTGAPHSLPYPVAADPPAGHTQMQALAAQVAVRLGARVYAEVNTSQSRNSGTPGDLATVGPSVTLTVPTNGLVAVFASVQFGAEATTGDVDLAEDGTVIGTILEAPALGFGPFYTAPGNSSLGTTNRNNAGWLVFPAAAGSHTYKLMYHTSGGSRSFLNRRLWGKTIPF